VQFVGRFPPATERQCQCLRSPPDELLPPHTSPDELVKWETNIDCPFCFVVPPFCPPPFASSSLLLRLSETIPSGMRGFGTDDLPTLGEYCIPRDLDATDEPWRESTCLYVEADGSMLLLNRDGQTARCDFTDCSVSPYVRSLQEFSARCIRERNAKSSEWPSFKARLRRR
jgi:hypothetical protein